MLLFARGLGIESVRHSSTKNRERLFAVGESFDLQIDFLLVGRRNFGPDRFQLLGRLVDVRADRRGKSDLFCHVCLQAGIAFQVKNGGRDFLSFASLGTESGECNEGVIRRQDLLAVGAAAASQRRPRRMPEIRRRVHACQQIFETRVSAQESEVRMDSQIHHAGISFGKRLFQPG
jgi:hypothetical protein